ncbi:HPF/RaiA family ribosome-associated protein [Dyadobacter tibetensis]|uniref:HPF/RaiA family ribosome-associated protein n=1 Tax=Dyadobacter tibetensis TaxID=1211851 RepID=UPI00046FC024|nr:HPF/RaiA family ribosome-associated protein [Dyadobacter tibetensis]
MTIQINTDKSLSVHAEYSDKLEGILSKELSRFADHITRLEVHLSDENGEKGGVKDKKCLLEARVKGRQPMVVSELGDTYDQSVIGATNKLKSSLTTLFGKLQSH